MAIGMNNANGWSALPILFIISPMLLLVFLFAGSTILLSRERFQYYKALYVVACFVLVSSIFLIGDAGGYGTQYFLGRQYDLEGHGSNTLPIFATWLGTLAGISFYLGPLTAAVILCSSAISKKSAN